MAATVPSESATTTFPRATLHHHDYRCTSCGYGISVREPPDACPMCRGTTWELGEWRPFSTSTAFRRPGG